MQQSLAVFGEILFDYFPDGSQILGGAPFNVAWHLRALNIQPTLITAIGDDAAAYKIQVTLKQWGLSQEGIQVHSDYSTGRVEISLDENEPNFSIPPDQAFDYIQTKYLANICNCQLLYHGSLALRHRVSRTAFEKLLSYNKPLFIDVNLRHPWWGKREVLQYLHQAKWAKVNKDELEHLSPLTNQSTLEQKAMALYEYSHLDWLIVTLGNKGALGINKSQQQIKVTASENIIIKDSVGAGDAFSAIILFGLLKNWSLNKTLKHAQLFAESVVEMRGATSSDRKIYQRFYQQLLTSDSIHSSDE